MPIEAKPQRRELVGFSPRTVPVGKRNWTDVEPRKCSFSDCEVSKKVMYLLRHSQHVYREEDGARQLWRMKENLQTHFLHSPHWSDNKWKASLAGGKHRKTFSAVLILQEQLCISELFKDIQAAILLILHNRIM